MILTCPACANRFLVDDNAIGPKGRRVRCGACNNEWLQLPTPEELDKPTAAAVADAPKPAKEHKAEKAGEADTGYVSPDEAAKSEKPEAAADSGAIDKGETPARTRPRFAAAAKAGTTEATAEKPATSAAKVELRAETDSRKEAAEAAAKTYADVEGEVKAVTVEKGRSSLWLLLLALLAGLLIAAYAGRVQIVERLPGLKPAYQALGIDVGLPGIGLKLFNITSVRRRENDADVLMIEGEIRNATNRPIEVPPLQVRIFDAEGDVVSSWTFQTDIGTLAPGEIGAFQTKAVNPPPEGVDTRLSFVAPEDLP